MEKHAKTHIERMGFVDDDLTTSTHDKMLMWLNNDNILKKILLRHSKTYNLDESILPIYNCNYGKCAKPYREQEETIRRFFEWFKIDSHKYEITKVIDVIRFNRCERMYYKTIPDTVLENFLTTTEYYKEGYNLLKEITTCSLPELIKLLRPCFCKHKLNTNWQLISDNNKYHRKDTIKSIEIDKKIEYPIKNNNYTLGFIDMFVNFKVVGDVEFYSDNWMFFRKSYKLETNFFIEVKTKITSLGETLRQMNFYKCNSPEDYIHVLVIPSLDLEMKHVFDEQEIAVIEYDKEK